MTRPRIKVVLKAKEENARAVPILAAWDRDGRLSASLDRSVVELAVRLEDGTIVRCKRGEDGRPTMWVNVYDDGSATNQMHAPTPSRAGSRQDTWDDELPF